MDYTRHVNDVTTPQRSRAKPEQVKNSAEGFVFEVDDWVKLDRFLVLGTEGGSYYASEKQATLKASGAVKRCVAQDGLEVVRRVVDVSTKGRAPKNDPALFVLAMCAKTGNDITRAAAWDAFPKVARIGTHVFQMARNVEAFGGWGRATKRGFARWYQDKEPEKLAYQLVKYRQRDGWSHRDILRLARPVPKTEAHSGLYSWTVGKGPGMGLLAAADELAVATTDKEAARLIGAYNLPRECVPTDLLTKPLVWEALLERMPMTAMIRNLATMTRIGLVAPMSNAAGHICSQLADEDRISKARIHPVKVLAALLTYQQGRGMRGQHTWSPVAQVVDALDGAFYKAFGNVEPTGKRTLLALDVSGSMGCGEIAGIPGLTPRVGSAAMSLITAATESQWAVCAFSTGFINLYISPRQRLDDVVRTISGLPFQGTDCALPMICAQGSKLEIDTFVIYTDSETWAGNVHPFQALREYRQKMGVNAKLVVVGMVSNDFTIADPNDAGMMDVVGFDTATPQLISDFARSA